MNSVNFEKVDAFKYIRVEINSTGNDNHKEIQQKINATNKCFQYLNQKIKIRGHFKLNKISVSYIDLTQPKLLMPI